MWVKKECFIFHKWVFIALALVWGMAQGVQAQTLAAWETSTLSSAPVPQSLAASTTHPAVTIAPLTRGSGLANHGAGGAFSATSFAIDGPLLNTVNNDYFETTLTVQSGYTVNLSEIVFNLRRTSAGPQNFQWYYRLNGGAFSAIGNPVYQTGSSATAMSYTHQVSALSSLPSGTIVTLRLYGWNATSGGGAGGIGNLAGNDLEIRGTATETTPAVPNAPTLTSTKSTPTTNAISLNWNSPSGTSTFRLERSYNGMAYTTLASNIPSSTLSISDTPLQDGTYIYRLYAINSAGDSSTAGTSDTLTIDTTPPAVPQLTITQPQSDTLSFSWNTPATTATFRLERSFNNGAYTVVSNAIPSTTTTYVDSALASGSYRYRLYALDSFGNTSTAFTTTEFSAVAVPNAPTLTSTKSTPTANAITLNWNSPSGTSTFRLERSYNGGGYTLFVNGIPSSIVSLVTPTLADGTYTYRLYAINSAGDSSTAGTSNTLTIDTTPPAVPQLTITQPQSDTLSFSWNTPATTATFRLERSFNNGAYTVVANAIPSTTTTYVDSALASGSYRYRLYALDSFGNTSTAFTTTEFSAVAVPNAPTLTSTKSTPTANAITLNWNSPSGTSTFRLERSYNGGGYTLFVNGIPSSIVSLVTPTLADGTYTYRLYAINSAGDSSTAGTSNTLTIDTTPPAAPTITASKPSETGTTITLFWNAPATTASFRLERAKDGGAYSVIQEDIDVANTSFADSSLTDGAYTYRLYALDSFGNTSLSGTSNTLTIDTTPPAAPTITASKPSETGTTITLFWNAPATTASFGTVAK